MTRLEIARKIPALATDLLHEKGYIAPADLLLRLGWLTMQDYQAWRFCQIPYLERAASGSLPRLSFAMKELRRYARQKGLKPSWTAYVAWGAGKRRPLRFSRSGDLAIEQAYATHWLSPLPPSKVKRPAVRKADEAGAKGVACIESRAERGENGHGQKAEIRKD